ncbi:hypothetical protein [Zunongwangia pacifica]|uniref:Uncharacterized protein n=1 Tax=Zunongwangia pacifica TaxID=2911062 RepID=A0A9X1ZWK5_9FLAO|nr:hypothetical protein [Zunongwangia pacifica]MCL6220540.1 hypothetical protein [Zunongwangia pacifica]
MKDPNTAPLFYADNLQKIEGDNQYTVDLHLPENFSYTDYKVIGNSQVVPDILKIEIYLSGDINGTPSDVTIVEQIDLDLSNQNFKYLKFKIVWKLSAGLGGGVGDPEDDETVGESVLGAG